MQVKAIRTETNHLEALRQVSALIDLDPDRDSPEGGRLEVIGTLVQAYEAEHHPIDPPDPIEVTVTAGATPRYVAQQLEHEDVDMVFSTYGKFIREDDQKPKAILRSTP